MKLPLSILLLVAVACIVQAQDFDVTRIQKHIKTLSDDKLEGRGTGTEGEKKAAAYIEAQFKKLKLEPKGDNNSYLQGFTFKGGAHEKALKGKPITLLRILIMALPPPSSSVHTTII